MAASRRCSTATSSRSDTSSGDTWAPVLDAAWTRTFADAPEIGTSAEVFHDPVTPPRAAAAFATTAGVIPRPFFDTQVAGGFLSRRYLGSNAPAEPLEQQIEAWRAHLRRSGAIASGDAAELEDHLREQIASLNADGLSEDEAFLVAVKRMGAQDAIANEFAREHSERLWKQLIVAPDATADAGGEGRREMFLVFALAVSAGIVYKVPELLFGATPMGGEPGFYLRNVTLFVLPLLAAQAVFLHALRYTGVEHLLHALPDLCPAAPGEGGDVGAAANQAFAVIGAFEDFVDEKQDGRRLVHAQRAGLGALARERARPDRGPRIACRRWAVSRSSASPAPDR